MLNIEKKTIVTVREDNGNFLKSGDLVIYTTKTNSCATLAYYEGLSDKGLVELTDFITKKTYTKVPASIATITKYQP